MAQSPSAVVTPAALRWARESIGYTVEQAAAKIGVSSSKLESAEIGDGYLTMRQAENAARLYERPLAALFLPDPPQEEAPEAQFRRLPGAPAPPWPSAMLALARRVRARQDAAAELYDVLDETPPWRELDIQFEEDPLAVAASIRQLLGISLVEQYSWRDTSGYTPLREWVDAVEALGVLVQQDGSLAVTEMRGFASTHPDVPAIVINTNDDPRARAFTVIHEFAHLIRAWSDQPTGPTTEQWCNDVASEVLAPGESFARDFSRTVGLDLLKRVDAVALTYGITPMAAAVRIARLRLAHADEIDDVLEAIDERARTTPRREGGDYYRNTIAQLGPGYIGLVFAALDNQAVTFPVASGLLGVKINNFGKLRHLAATRASE